jgi:hypothetical protein
VLDTLRRLHERLGDRGMLRRFDPSETPGTEQIEEAAFNPCIQPKPLKGAIIRVTSSGGVLVVLVDEAAEPVATVDLTSRRSRL